MKLKHIKVKVSCNSCKKSLFSKPVITQYKGVLHIPELTKDAKEELPKINVCPKCNSENLKKSYTFYHEEILS